MEKLLHLDQVITDLTRHETAIDDLNRVGEVPTIVEIIGLVCYLLNIAYVQFRIAMNWFPRSAEDFQLLLFALLHLIITVDISARILINPFLVALYDMMRLWAQRRREPQ